MCIRILTGTRGQATPLWAMVLLVAAMLLVPMGLVARAAIERSRAQSAADAAALAGASAGEAEARAVARLNGARVERYEAKGDTVEVVVVVGGRRATARAVREEVHPRRGPAGVGSASEQPAAKRGPKSPRGLEAE